jgi:membrane protein
MATTTWKRGRDANRPSEIPASGWKDTLYRVKQDIKDDRLSLVAAAMSYYALLAFVPAITSLVLIYAWVSDPAQISVHLSKVSNILPAELTEILNGQLSSLASKSAVGLGAIGTLLFALWSASKGSRAIMEALNIIYEEDESRGFVKQIFMAIGLTALGAVLGIVAIGVIVGVPAVLNFFNLGKITEILGTIGSWVILLGLFSFFLSFVYRFGPCRNKAKWNWVSRGAIISSVLWALVSVGFSFYASKFGDFNKTYGSLGAVIVLMIWFYLSSFVILLGAEVNAELEHQTGRDTTEGQPKRMGERGAEMADTLGPSIEEIKRGSRKPHRPQPGRDQHLH